MDNRDNTQYVAGTVPVNLAAGATTAQYVSLKNANHIEIVIIKAAGASGEAPTFTFVQAKNVSGSEAKALNFTKYYRKSGTQSSIGAPSYVNLATPANTIALAAGNTQELIVVEFDSQNLDATNGFDCVAVTVNDVGDTAQWCAIVYRLSEVRTNARTTSFIAD